MVLYKDMLGATECGNFSENFVHFHRKKSAHFCWPKISACSVFRKLAYWQIARVVWTVLARTSARKKTLRRGEKQSKLNCYYASSQEQKASSVGQVQVTIPQRTYLLTIFPSLKPQTRNFAQFCQHLTFFVFCLRT